MLDLGSHVLDVMYYLLGEYSSVYAKTEIVYSFLSCVYEKKQASPSFREGAYIQYVMESAYESDRQNKWIDLA